MKRLALILGAASLLFAAGRSHSEEKDHDLALEPAHIIVSPWKQHIPPTKRQGIERTAKGRLWAVHGRDVESTRNFQVLGMPPAAAWQS